MASDVVARLERGAFPSIDHIHLSRLADAGAVDGARAIGMAGKWVLLVVSKGHEWVLTATRSKSPRGFAKVETLLGYLRELDVPQLDVDVSTAANVAVKTRRREDRSEALRALWDADIKEARSDPRPQIAHADVLARSQARWAADLDEEAKSKPASLQKPRSR